MEKTIIALLKKTPMSREELRNHFQKEARNNVDAIFGQLCLKDKIEPGEGNKFKIKSYNKHRNIITVIDGIKFRSKKEGGRYQELKLLEQIGEITKLNIQVPFIVADAVGWGNSFLKPICYYADFEYYEKGRRVVEDTKGMRTKLYILKRQLFLLRYPDIEFRES